MKKLVLSLVLFGLPVIGFSAAKETKLPFVGTKFVNFSGGSGTNEEIIIKTNGDTRVEYIGSTGSAVEYKGKFSNPLKFKEGGGILFKDGKAYSLDKGGKVEQNGCENTPCVSDLGDEMR